MKQLKKECEEEMITKERIAYFDNLPDEILTSILVWLPAELLQSKFKYVCKRWFNIITHQILFDHASIIIQKPVAGGYVYRTRVVHLNEGLHSVKFKEQYLNIPVKGRVRSWCNELLLITEPHNNGSLFIYNLKTKLGSALPRDSNECGGHVKCNCSLGIAFDKYNGIYKVVHVYAASKETFKCEMFMLRNETLFLNSSKWKTIGGPSYIGGRKYYWEDPVTVNGRYFHWHVRSKAGIVAMDIVEETFHYIRLPPFISEYSLVEMGGYLCLLSNSCDKKSVVWILKHFDKQEWHKRHTIRNFGYSASADCCMERPSFPIPVTCLNNGSYIICRNFKGGLGLHGYRLETGHMRKLHIHYDVDERFLAQSVTLD